MALSDADPAAIPAPISNRSVTPRRQEGRQNYAAVSKPFGSVNFSATELERLRELAAAGISRSSAESGRWVWIGAGRQQLRRPLSPQRDLSDAAGQTPRMPA
jgi:hypothetical protein